mmetsp:Transcript_25966/g.54175  ORF Transcript_25966/g.54175 Transcript_25966/m.54175 type:complete len:140 (-) Transcript_25966:3865-4284(-)
MPNHRRQQILLGVSGSVAAVKAPEIAVRLCRELNANVKILLTAGARNFWEQAHEYSDHWWQELQKLMSSVDQEPTVSGTQSGGSAAKIQVLRTFIVFVTCAPTTTTRIIDQIALFYFHNNRLGRRVALLESIRRSCNAH